jgi:hypothetical protein
MIEQRLDEKERLRILRWSAVSVAIALAFLTFGVAALSEAIRCSLARRSLHGSAGLKRPSQI